MPSRADADALDAADPLRAWRDRFVVPDPALVYLDGNSLGRAPAATVERLGAVLGAEWAGGLIRSWAKWLDLPARVGDELGTALLGAAPGQVALSDSTTVNFYKLACAALDARPGRTVVVTDTENFPTDRYVLDGLAHQRGLTVRLVRSDPVEPLTAADVAPHLGTDVALITFSHVAYASAAVNDLAGITAAAHDAGALALWDLSHTTGSVPCDLDANGVDLAVGCTYKYLNAGPGAPAFLYVRRELQPTLRSPIWGWFGQQDQFAMGPAYEPTGDIRRFLAGTPPVPGVVAVAEGVRLLAGAGLDALRAKGMALTSFAVELFDERLAPIGFALGSPRDPHRRGSHVTVRHPDAAVLCSRLQAERGIVTDFRAPDRIRLGLAALTTSFADVWDAVDALAALAPDGS